MRYIAVVAALMMAVSSARADLTAVLKEVIRGGDTNRPGILQVTIDDGDLQYTLDSPNPLIPTTNVGNRNWALIAGDEYGSRYIGVVGLANFFDVLPGPAISKKEDILHVDFVIRHRGPTGGEHVGVYRVITPWLLEDAGLNEARTSAKYIVPGADPLYWAGGADVGFSSLDYTTEDAQDFYITDTTRNLPHLVDITEMARDWFTEGNNGLCLILLNSEQFTDAPYFQPSEANAEFDLLADGSSPALEFVVTYVPEPATMGLLVLGGLGVLLGHRRRSGR